MVCYIIPLVVALVQSAVWGSRKSGPAGWWLNLLLYGGAIFGVVDHLWYGELFLIGEAPLMDLMLGVTITLTIFAGWGIALGIAKISPEFAHRTGILRVQRR